MNWNNLELPENPYYQDDAVLIYHADCREILPQLPKVDLVLTDPPYPKLEYEWEYIDLRGLHYDCRQFYFWLNPPEPFPLPFTALHIWSKANTYIGQCELYESIYEVNGHRIGSVIRAGAINCKMNAQMNRDIFYEHPTQKPMKVINRLIQYATQPNNLILDPFLGSGTTAYCAKKLNRKCIGIEIEEKYCEIAAKRCMQSVLNFNIEAENIAVRQQPMI